MKRILFLLALVCLVAALYAQQPYIYTIKADSVKNNTCDTAELIIENPYAECAWVFVFQGQGKKQAKF